MTWLTGIIKVIFGCKKIFGSGHFSIFFHILWIKKMAGAKKVVNMKNRAFHVAMKSTVPLTTDAFGSFDRESAVLRSN